MAERNFKLSIDVNSKKAEKDLKKFNRTLDDTNKKTKDNTKTTKDSGKGFGGLVTSLGPATKALGAMGIAVGAATAAYVGLNNAVLSVAQRARDIQNFARVADTSILTFQALNVAAQEYGVTGEKVADQIKDFQDRLGDFTANGAGPLVDTFKLLEGQTTLTAQELSVMSGPEAIGAIITALKDANITGAEYTQQLEAIASDLKLTAPLFENNAEKIGDMEKELVKLGAVLSQDQIDNLNKYAKQVELLDTQWLAFKANLSQYVIPVLETVNGIMSNMLADDPNPFANMNLADTEAQLARINQQLEAVQENTQKPRSFLASMGRNTSGIAGGGSSQTINAQQIADVNKLTAEQLQAQERIKQLKDEQATQDQNAIDQAKRLKDLQKQQADAMLASQQKIVDGITVERDLVKEQFNALQQSDSVYQTILDKQKRSADIARWRLDLEKQGIVVTDQMVAAYDRLLSAQLGITREASRVGGFRSRLQSMQRELDLLNLTSDAQRERLTLEHELQDLNLTADEAGTLRALNEQIMARQQHLDLLEKEKDAVQNLAQAMGRWASGSKDAVKQVIAELIRLVAIRSFGGTGPFLGGFLTGFGSGGMQGYAQGGQFNAGETFMVGEQGPEIITASAPGNVIANHQLGGMGGASIVISPTLSINGGINSADDINTMFREFSYEIANQTQSMIKRELRPRGVLA